MITDLAILMPPINGQRDRFKLRFGGLVEQLQALSISSVFAETIDRPYTVQYDLVDVFDIDCQPLAPRASATVVRNLTAPTAARPAHADTHFRASRQAHAPATNNFIADKSKLWERLPTIHPKTKVVTADTLAEAIQDFPGETVVIKPTTGLMSRDVHVVAKANALQLQLEESKRYLLQEFIDTSEGIPELGVAGLHNIRIISIASKVIGAIARVGGTNDQMLKGDVYGGFIPPEDLPAGMLEIAHAVQNVLQALPGDGKNIIAIDVMRGRDGAGKVRDVLCEVNRRPMRISKWNLRDNPQNHDASAIREMAHRWDVAEARMLADLVTGKRKRETILQQI